ncbi:transposase family protein [Pseudarthrobacter sp. P1]|uniref:transposase family protein n=1 Tax=Pseudarthrobacter sp. P1 TaxID=3418418 RepID=UPI003CE9A48A
MVFPHWDTVLVEQVHRMYRTVRVSARTRDGGPFPCPDCEVVSRRGHSRYRRHIADTAVGGKSVVLELSVRHLFCDDADHPRCSYSEQVNGMTTRYRRRTPVQVKVLHGLSLVLAGGRGPGGRLALAWARR